MYRRLATVHHFDRFPDLLRKSTVPRWSHRDPVESDNPFSPDDDRHQIWAIATRLAKTTLVRIDEQFNTDPARHPPDKYPARVVVLARLRFDVWSERALSVVMTEPAVEDYSRWLSDYTDNWLNYIDDTCPNINIRHDMRAHLTTQSRFWVNEAKRRLVQPVRYKRSP